MPLAEFMSSAGIWGWVYLATAAGTCLWALPIAGLLAMRWKVPPVIAAAPLGFAPLLLVLHGLSAAGEVEAAIQASDPAGRATILAAAISRIMSLGVLQVVIVPGAILLGVGGFFAGIRGPRRWGAVVGVGMLAALATLFSLGGAFLPVDLPHVVLNTTLMALGVLPVALSMANAHAGGNGPEGGVTATAAWVTVVASLQLSLTSSAWEKGFSALAMVTPEQKAQLATALAEEVGKTATLGWFVLALAVAPLVLAVFREGPPLTEAEILDGSAQTSPWRSLGRVATLGIALLWGLALIAMNPSGSLARIVGG